MKLLFDFFPIILFFTVFKLKDIYWATATAIAASILQIGWMLIRRKPVPFQLWLSLFVVSIFGGLTLILHNDAFIKLKPTVLYFSLALVLLFGQVVLKKNLIKSLLGKELILEDRIWSKLNISWMSFFAVVAVLNLFVVYYVCARIRADALARHLTQAVANRAADTFWVNFKLFGVLGLTFVFAIGQALVLARFVKTPAPKPPEGTGAPPN